MDGIIVWFSLEKKMGLVKNIDGKIFLIHKDQISKNKIEKIEIGQKIKFQMGEFPGFVESIKIER